MSKIHLSEEQHQHYALDGFTDPDAIEHIGHCMHCQMQVSAYQILYSHIREAEAPLLDSRMERLVLDQLPAAKARDRREVWFLYSLLFIGIALLVVVLMGSWGVIRWIFSGITIPVLVFGLVLLLGVLTIQLMELYGTYRRKIRALNPE